MAVSIPLLPKAVRLLLLRDSNRCRTVAKLGSAVL